MTSTDWDNINKISSQLKDAFTHYTPQVWNALQKIKQIDSIGSAIQCLIFEILGFLAVFFAIKFSKKIVWSFGEPEDAKSATFLVATIVLLIFAPIAICISSICISDIWLWVGIFDPQLAIAHDVVNKILSTTVNR